MCQYWIIDGNERLQQGTSYRPLCPSLDLFGPVYIVTIHLCMLCRPKRKPFLELVLHVVPNFFLLPDVAEGSKVLIFWDSASRFGAYDWATVVSEKVAHFLRRSQRNFWGFKDCFFIFIGFFAILPFRHLSRSNIPHLIRSFFDEFVSLTGILRILRVKKIVTANIKAVNKVLFLLHKYLVLRFNKSLSKSAKTISLTAQLQFQTKRVLWDLLW